MVNITHLVLSTVDHEAVFPYFSHPHKMLYMDFNNFVHVFPYSL